MNQYFAVVVLPKIREFFDTHLLLLGQIGGYGAGLISWLLHSKEFISYLGVAAGTTLSIWALVDKVLKTLRKRKIKRRMSTLRSGR